MRIDDRTSSVTPGVGSSAGSASGSKTNAAGASSGGGDSVELSGLSRIFQNIPGQRSARINQLTTAVQNGTYSVDPAQVSGALVRETLARAQP